MQNKITIRYYLIPISPKQKITSVVRMYTNYNENPCVMLEEIQNGTATEKTVQQFLKTLKMHLAISFRVIHPKEIKSLFQTDSCTLMFITPLFIVAKM